MYEKFLKPILFNLDPETAHDTATGWLKTLDALPLAKGMLNGRYGQADASLTVNLFGKQCKSPIGLA
ncbi:MAG TPA: hypothetical protein V6C72_13830, partial [Chroococcales cyanobacterium]